ncbi:ATP-binding protein [Actinoplanes friuliensis]|uniref:Sensor-like histidine kinase SenX3 n=1 Tax=Actinoplanes friuliensis DSM 7358 TaxID=1246995 RepID=U5VUY8_9ACTN|nr:ATP-binding protein [Actinoplanes friuliensis]AGZ40602.1 putative histidine kinase, classic [Actinoplanes friuliensis DSM 7358]
MEIRKVISRRGAALAGAVLALGLGTGATAATSLALAEQDASTAALALRTASVRGALDTTFQRYADTMHSLVAAAATEPAARLSPAVARLTGDTLPGAHQVVVVDANRTVLAQHTVDGSNPPPRTTLNPEPSLARGLDLARESGRLVASPAHVLPADLGLPPAHRQPAFELISPVHENGFRGWVVIGVRAPDLLRESLRAAGVTGVATVLTETSGDGVTHEVARWAEGGGPLGESRGTVDVALAGHTWQILVRPTTALVSAGRAAAAPLTLLGSALISVVAAGLLLVADRGRHRAEDHARQAAADSRAEIDRARAAEAVLHERTRTAEAQLREREAELTGFATAAADHLHAPLHTIAGFTELLLEDAGPLDEASRGFLDRIGRSTGRMLALVDDLLAYSSAADAALKLEPVDAGGLALGVVAGRLDHVTGERPSIDVGDLPAVTADAELLGEVLGQLVDNAVRFVRHGTAARVTIGAREHVPGWWRIEVADRGIGVPEEQRTRIFAPFHRAPAAEGFPGTGLGLAVCRRIVDLHGGELGVDPNPGGGSIFWFTVPTTGLTPARGADLFAADLA